VSLSLLDTYIDRPTISAEIASKMQKSCGSKTLVHALALVGLGGTGKTQLAVRYIQQHRKHYDTVLWLDVRDKTSTLSSFERCCGALSITLEKRTDEGLLHDTPAVQKLLAWLAGRKQEQKWLVVLDNADELDELVHIVPSNVLAGSVIITSQDGKAAKLVPRAKCTKVDKVEMDECKALLAQSINKSIDLSNASLNFTSRLEKLANRLDCMALALDLASARIWDDIDNRDIPDDIDPEGPAISAIEQYLVDLEVHAKTVLSDSELNATSAYKKTIWSVWETILSSLKRSEQADPEFRDCTIQLLKLAVMLGPTIVHREIFRGASQSLAAMSVGLTVDLPLWFRHLLRVSGAGVWDSLAYRRSIARLKRFNLIRSASQDEPSLERSVFEINPESVSWSGFTIHGLVRWCADSEMPEDEYEVCRGVLVTACCHTWTKCDDGIDLRWVLTDYMRRLGGSRIVVPFTPTHFAEVCTAFGTTFLSTREIQPAERAFVAGRTLTSELFGESASETMLAEVELARFYQQCSLEDLVQEDPAKRREWAEKAKRIQKAILDHPEGEIRISAASWNREMIIAHLSEWWTERFPMECLALRLTTKWEREDSTTIEHKVVNAKYDTLSATVISEQLQALELGLNRLGQHDRVVNMLRFNLVHLYGIFEKYDLAKQHLMDLVAYDHKQIYGRFDDRRVQTIEMLAICELKLRDPEAATDLMRTSWDVSLTALGDEDPRTRLREKNLKRLENGEWEAMLAWGETTCFHSDDERT